MVAWSGAGAADASPFPGCGTKGEPLGEGVLCSVTMFGMGMSEILVILLVAALFLGPEKLPDAATKISKGIRDLRRQTRDLQDTIENDTELGGAIRDLKSALRGDELRRPPAKRPAVKASVAAAAAAVETAEAAALPAAVVEPPSPAAAPEPELASAAPPVTASEAAPASEATAAVVAAPVVPTLTLAPTAGESELDPPPEDEVAELARLVRPVSGAVKRDDHGPS